MKYQDKEQIKNYLLKSSLVTFDKERSLVQFIGLELERCELKVSNEIMYEIYQVCKLLEINHLVI